MATLKDREIFKIGKWAASTGLVDVTSEMLDQVVTGYTELNSVVSGYGIPIKLGHNRRVGEPAFGWAENVRRDGDTLLADFTDVPPEIVDAINQKRYNAVSVELRNGVAFEGKSFPNVLGGVALLGAEWPAVKGLRPISAFQDSEAVLALSQEEEQMPNFTQEQVDAAVAVETAKLAAAVTRAETAETALSVFQDEAEKKAVALVIEAAEKAGKIVPANKVATTAMAEALRVSVEPTKRAAALATFTAFIEALPKKVDFKEEAASDSQRPGDDTTTAGDEVVAEVKKLQAKDKTLSFRDGMKLVFETNEDLKNRYAEENRNV